MTYINLIIKYTEIYENKLFDNIDFIITSQLIIKFKEYYYIINEKFVCTKINF
jgi:hypothetical protein